MQISEFEKKLAWLLAIGGCLTSIMVLAWNANEPVNAPKLLILGSTGFAALFAVFFNFEMVSKSKIHKLLYLSLALFIILSLVSIFKSESSFVTGFFGVWGRNTGFITYACLSIILAAASQIKSVRYVEKTLEGLFYAGIVNVIYFILTLLGVELIPWNNVYERVLGTFGNPNFVGAFMGLFIILCFVKIIDRDKAKWMRILCLILIPFTLFEIKKSLASQGVVITGLGLAILGFFYLLWNVKSKIPVILYSGLSVIFGALALAGALQKGPLAGVIYKSSVSFRGEYWAAGVNMGLDNPVFGVGLDSYGIWYRYFRNASALISPGKDVITNTAHNVFIDIFAAGGFPLLLAYVVITVLVLLKIISGLKNIKSFDPTFAALTILWICYQVQSLVSINQIGIAIWGWTLSGLLIGYETQKVSDSLSNENREKIQKHKGRMAPKEKKRSSTIPMIIGAVVGFVIVAPPYLADVNWRSVLMQPTEKNLEEGAKKWPLTPEIIVQASEIYSKNNLPQKGVEMAKFATEKFPMDFRVWYFYYMNPNIGSEEKLIAKSHLHQLDPLNSDFK